MVKNRTTAIRLASEESVLQKNLYQFQKNLYYKIMGGTDDWADCDWGDWAAAKKPPAPTEQPTEGGGGEQSSSAAPNKEWGGKQWDNKEWGAASTKKEDWADKSTSKKEDWGGESKDWGASANSDAAPNKEDLRVR